MKQIHYKLNMNESEAKTIASLLKLIDKAFKYNAENDVFQLQNEFKDMSIDFHFYADALNVYDRLKTEIIKKQ